MSERIFPLPDVGEGLTEAEIVTWKVAVGDTIALNQALVDIETAKAVVELPSPYAGVVISLGGKEGDVILVGDPLVVIDTAADAPAATGGAPTERTPVLVGYGVEDEGDAPRRRRASARNVAVPAPAPAALPSTGPVRTTPPVRLLAKKNGIDLARLTGTGTNGLVTRADLERALAGTSAGPRPRVAAASSPQRFAGREIAPWSDGPPQERIAVRGVTKTMADAMTLSATTVPHAAVWVTADVSRSMRVVEALKSRGSLGQVRVSPLALIALAVCDGVRQYPGMNSYFDTATNEVVLQRRIALGIAADTPRGLIVPNIPHADSLDLPAMARELMSLVDTARAGTTTPAAMAGTTITITNVGPMGVDGAVPVLPLRTGAIIAVGQIRPTPWVENSQVVVREVMQLVMSFDHRMIDGALASRFLAHVAGYLNDPPPELLLW